MTSYKPEVLAAGETKFAGNALRFATMSEAEMYLADLARRWTAVVDTRVVLSDDPVNYTIDPESGRAVKIEDGD